jgi:ACS family glucarate transporter-like MFS transporter
VITDASTTTTKPAIPLRWVLIIWLFVLSAIGYLDRVNISIAGSSIVREFHLSNIQLGWLFSAFLVGYALFQAPGGMLSDRFGPRAVLTLGVIWWGIFTSLITFVSASMGGLILLLVAIRFLLGTGEAVVYPASNCIVASWIPSSERGFANGLIFSGVGLGAAISPPLITYLMVNYGWRASFWVSALIGLVAGFVWFLIARDKPAQHKWLDPQEAEFIREGLPPTHRKSAAKLPWSSIVGNPHILMVTGAYFTFGYSAYLFFSWFFIYLNTVRGLDLRRSAYFSMLPFAAMAIGSTFGGIISDRITRNKGKRLGRCGLAAFGLFFAGVFLALGTQVASAQFASLVLAAGAGSLYLSQSSFWSVSADMGGKSAGSVSGFMNMGCQIGGALTASATAYIAANMGWTASFLVAAVLCIVGAFLWLFVQPEAQLGVAASVPQGTSDDEEVRRSTSRLGVDVS